jgi:hypothetical protein
MNDEPFNKQSSYAKASEGKASNPPPLKAMAGKASNPLTLKLQRAKPATRLR